MPFQIYNFLALKILIALSLPLWNDFVSVKIEIPIFGDFVDEVNNFIATGDTQQVVVVVQFAKVKTFKGL